MFEDFWNVLSIDFGSFLPIKKDPYLRKNKRKTETFEGIRSCKIPGRAQRASERSERASRAMARPKPPETTRNCRKLTKNKRASRSLLRQVYVERFLRAKTAPRRLQDAPRRPQDAPKTPQDGPKTPPSRAKTAQEAPRRPQDAQNPPKMEPSRHQNGIKNRSYLKSGEKLKNTIKPMEFNDF